MKLVPIQGLSGFGNGNRHDESYYSQLFSRTLYGAAPFWSFNAEKDSASDLPNLKLVLWQTQVRLGGADYTYALDPEGGIFRRNAGVWEQQYKIAISGANGIIGDPKNRLLYVTDQYIGKFEGGSNYTDGTVEVTNGSDAVVGTGTTFTTLMEGKRFRIDGEDDWYTVVTRTDDTHITIDRNYEEQSGSGKNYTIYTAWDDEWQDLATSISNSLMPTEHYEGDVLIGRDNHVCRLVTEGDTLANDNSPAFDFPSGFVMRNISSNKPGILLAANFNNQGVLALWDNHSDRSIAPWIWLSGNIQSVTKHGSIWIVVTTNEIVSTNGYVAEPLTEFIDSRPSSNSFTVYPQGTAVLKNNLLILNNRIGIDRNKPGVYAYHLTRGVWDYLPVLNTRTRNVELGSVFNDSNSAILVSASVRQPVTAAFVYHLANIVSGSGFRGLLVSQPAGPGTNRKVAAAVKLVLAANDFATTQPSVAGDIAVKIAPQNRQMWAIATTAQASGAAAEIVVNGTTPANANPEVGDEVTVMDGANAGEIRHIASIANPGANNETWTLDEDLPNNTEDGVSLNVSPFKLLKKYTLSGTAIDDELWFPCRNKIKGRKFYVKVLMENFTSAAPEILEAALLYEDLGTMK